MGALLFLLSARGVDFVAGDLEATLRFVVAAAALACTRNGAHAPSRHEVEAAIAGG
jgi:sugar/nucleoside kinase (ribokinase family)